MKNNNTSYQLAKRLINVTNSILHIYDNLLTFSNDKVQYNKKLDDLKVGFEIENDLYKEIGQELLTSQEFFNALRLASENTDIDEIDLEEINFRISNYIDSFSNFYPFKEVYYPSYENQILNNSIIDRQIILDIDLLNLYNLQNLMFEENLNFLLPYFYDAKHSLLFRCKYYDNLAFKEITSAKPTARERLLAFNHNEEIVNNRFKNVIINGLKLNIENALAFEDSEKEEEDLSQMLINLIQIKTYLDLTTKEEAFDIFNSYYQLFENNKELSYLKNSSVNEEIKYLIKLNYVQKNDHQNLKELIKS